MNTQEFRDKDAERKRLKNALRKDVGDIPPVVNSQRKERALHDFRFFSEQYLPKKFTKAWSVDHLEAIAEIEERCLRGGLKALSMPRGNGKTTICEAGAIWSVLTGVQPFVMLIGASKEKAQSMMDNVKAELSSNPLLLEDFPEVCHPIACLDGEPRKCRGQTHHGIRTLIQWGERQVVLPTIPGSKASGVILRAAGLTAAVRGANFRRPDGSQVRPTFCIVDDPQTDTSAKSELQCNTREAIISGGLLGLAGPGVKMAVAMPCTVIRRGDVAHRFLDREKHPDWHGKRTQLVIRWPDRNDLWDEYARIRADDLRAGGTGAKATAFYARHRAEMDKGAEVSWSERYNPDELSAIQHAVNLRLRDPVAFAAEYQGDPQEADTSDEQQVDADHVLTKVNGHGRRVVPVQSEFLTAFIDVHKQLLYWTVCAWTSDLSGSVVDYGTWPRQSSYAYSLRHARPTIQSATKAKSLEGQLFAALDALSKEILLPEWGSARPGVSMRVERCLIDANWGKATNIVYQWCRATSHKAIVLPSHGKYFGPKGRSFEELAKRPGDRMGLNWRITSAANKRGIRYVTFDTNFWKSLVADRLLMEMGEPGSIELYEEPGVDHRLLCDHYTSELRSTPDEPGGRRVEVWKLKPGAAENHYWDDLVGCAVGASIMGASPLAAIAPMPVQRTLNQGRMTLAEMQRLARGRA